MKILVLSTHAIGDTFISASAISIFKEKFDSTEIDFLTHKKIDFLDDLNISRNIIINRRSILSILKAIFDIRKEKYDYMFLFIPSRINTLIYLLGRAKKKFGFLKFLKNDNFFEDNWNLWKDYSREKVQWAKEDNYTKLIKLSLNKAFDSNCDVKKPVYNSNTEINKKRITFHPMGSNKNKQLADNDILEISSFLTETLGFEVDLITWGNEANDLRQIEMNRFRVVENLNYKDLAKQIKSSRFFLGVDSFPLHIADANHIRSIGLFYETNPNSIVDSKILKLKFHKPLSRISSKDVDNIKNNLIEITNNSQRICSNN